MMIITFTAHSAPSVPFFYLYLVPVQNPLVLAVTVWGSHIQYYHYWLIPSPISPITAQFNGQVPIPAPKCTFSFTDSRKSAAVQVASATRFIRRSEGSEG